MSFFSIKKNESLFCFEEKKTTKTCINNQNSILRSLARCAVQERGWLGAWLGPGMPYSRHLGRSKYNIFGIKLILVDINVTPLHL